MSGLWKMALLVLGFVNLQSFATTGLVYCCCLDLRETGWEAVDWMRLVQDRNQWRALVSTVMNLLVSEKGGEFLV